MINLAKHKEDITKQEIKILEELSKSEPSSILEGDDLIDVLQVSKEKAANVTEQLIEAEKTEVEV